MKTTKSWATLLQQEIAKPEMVFTPEHKSRDEIAAEFKEAGLPCGISYVLKYLRLLMTEGKVSCVEGLCTGPSGRRVRCVKYLIK
jgi:hypothetical protein